MRIALIGATYTGNRGAAAMVISTVEKLRERLPGDVEFRVFSLYREKSSTADERGVNIEYLPAVKLMITLPVLCVLYSVFHWFSPAAKLLLKYPPLRILAKSDVLLDLSGISFVDGRGATLLYNVQCIFPALLLKIPVFKMSQAMGPFKNTFNRIASLWLLPRLKRIYSRGVLTSKYLSELGLDNWEEAADLAFLLDGESGAVSKVSFGNTPGTFTIGVAPSQVILNYCRKVGIDYLGELTHALDSIRTPGKMRLVILAHSNLGGRNTSRNNDYHVCRELFEKCSCSDKHLVNEDLTPEELRVIISRCDVFVASRFHSMISALCEIVPVLVTSWSHKYREVMDEFECGEWVIGTDDLTADRLSGKLGLLINNREQVRSLLEKHLPEAVSSAQVQIDEVVQFLKAGNP